MKRNINLNFKIFSFFLFFCYLKGADNKILPKTVRIIRIEEEVVIDGKIEERFYSKIPFINIKFLPDGKVSNIDTKVYIFRDNDFLYISFIAEEPNSDKLKFLKRNRDGNIWEDDDFEFFIQTNENKYFQILINPIGSICDLKYEDGFQVKWDGVFEWASYIGDKFWSSEIKVPLKEFDIKFYDGIILKGNVVRSRRVEGNEYISWSLPTSQFHDIEKWGYFVFDNEYERSLNVEIEKIENIIKEWNLEKHIKESNKKEEFKKQYTILKKEMETLKSSIKKGINSENYAENYQKIFEIFEKFKVFLWEVKFHNLLIRGGAI